MPRLKKEDEKKLKQAVVDAAVQMNCKTSSESLKMESLVRQSGLSRQFIYRHFEGKEGVLLAAAQQIYEQIYRSVIDGGDRVTACISENIYDRDKEILIMINEAGNLFYEYTVLQILGNGVPDGEMGKRLNQLYRSRLEYFEAESKLYSIKQLSGFHRYVVLGVGLCVAHDREWTPEMAESLMKTYGKLESIYWKELLSRETEQVKVSSGKSDWKKVSELFQSGRKDNSNRQLVRRAVRILAKEQPVETITIEQISRKTGMNANTIYLEYESRGEIMDDMAVCIWTSVLRHTARIWLQKDSLKKKMENQFRATVRILRIWGGDLSCRILTDDSNFCRNTKTLCRSLAYHSGVGRISGQQINCPEVRALAYAAWSIWTGCCITVSGDRCFQKNRLECYSSLAAALGMACIHLLQEELKKMQRPAE